MFSSLSPNPSQTDCLGYDTIVSSKTDDQKQLTDAPNDARRAILQFHVDPSKAEDVAGQPIALLSEKGDVVPGFDADGRGFLICNYGVYEVNGVKNLNGFKFATLDATIEVFCRITYYK